MTRYKQKFALTGLAGLLAVVALTVAVAPSGATLVCPPGTTNPAYCKNVPPVAITQKATDVRFDRSLLNGVVGPNVKNGDATTYFFQYGKTNSYGQNTPSGTVGACPPGESGPNYCKSPATKHVSYDLRGLQPCTTYHFRIKAKNPDGSATGGDQKFTTGFLSAIQSVYAPGFVQHSRRQHPHFFTVIVRLKVAAQLSVLLQRAIPGHPSGPYGETVDSYSSHGLTAGRVSVTFQAPGAAGRYVIKVIATESCGKQIVFKTLNVF